MGALSAGRLRRRAGSGRCCNVYTEQRNKVDAARQLKGEEMLRYAFDR